MILVSLSTVIERNDNHNMLTWYGGNIKRMRHSDKLGVII